MTSVVIVDSGPLVALTDETDPQQPDVLAAFEAHRRRLIVPALCVAEAAYLVERDLGPQDEAMFIEGLREFDIEAPTPGDLARMAELIRQYSNFPLGATDASIVALAERLEATTIITLDRRHFGQIRPRHVEAFEILP